ncbi:hypothetical protein FACS189431_5720 [Alphaproteobacteria bacterium]|nr:hypothetical protein FACS189431_5720 [Alphaproteobacteria bacterium]
MAQRLDKLEKETAKLYRVKLELIKTISGWGNKTLGNVLDVSDATLSHWLHAKAVPSEEHVKKIDKLDEKLSHGLHEKLEYTRREYIESLEKSFHRHEIYELDKNNKEK